MSRILLYIIAICLLTMLLSSCVSTKQRARNLVRRGYENIQKGIKLDPSVIDSVKSVTDMPISVPGDSGTVQINPAIDINTWDDTMGNYDADLLTIDSLNDLLKSGKLSSDRTEQIMSEQKKAIQSLKRERERLKYGFAKDSTYVYEDSLVRLKINFKAGQLNKVVYDIKDRVIIAKVPTVDLKLDGRQIIDPWRQRWFWIMLGALILMSLLAIIALLKR